VIEYLVSGGPVMIPIGISSVAALAAFFERLWSLRRSRVVPEVLVRQVTSLLEKGEVEQARGVCAGSSASVARVLALALELRGRPRALIKERLEEVGQREAAELERFLPVLSTVAALGPLLGLLGTVGGMIVTFEGFKVAQNQDTAAMAGGIAQALITTFAGLVVAIPAVVAHRFLTGRVDQLVLGLEEASVAILERVAEQDR